MKKRIFRVNLLMSVLLMSIFYLFLGSNNSYAFLQEALSKSDFYQNSTEFSESKAKTVVLELVNLQIENDVFDDVNFDNELESLKQYSNSKALLFVLDKTNTFLKDTSTPKKCKIPLYVLFCKWKIHLQ
jgi:hypothetical protein